MPDPSSPSGWSLRPPCRIFHSTVWLAQANELAHRWLENCVQANLYGSVGEGARITPTKSTAAVHEAVEADWETRRIYANTRLETLASPGLAPFEGLHTWLVLEGDLRDHHFYQNVLWEMGTSLEEGDTHLSIAIELGGSFSADSKPSLAAKRVPPALGLREKELPHHSPKIDRTRLREPPACWAAE